MELPLVGLARTGLARAWRAVQSPPADEHAERWDDPGFRDAVVEGEGGGAALDVPRLPDDLTGMLDLVYPFDVFVHFDLHLLWRYTQEIARVLKPGGTGLWHTSNLTAPEGWRRFAAQDRYRVEGHYVVSPDIVRTLLARAGLEVVGESAPDADNFHLARDFLCLSRKPA